ncbi:MULTISPECIES: DUF2304 domain-containing protein [unclassified Adlercreutzia]|uniref:DUF2304 domain-containing protein n=1 Tax=unclassified Adlercreutzia TaxID=2636013 RepID=UPI0013EAC8D8|nr:MULTISPECIES: DUF2304 domain-containing protein [unclassified Adlercreutzia]
MTPVLRIVLVAVSILTFAFMTRKIRNAKVRLEDSVFWYCFAVLLLLVSVFPGVFFVLAGLVGVSSPVNFVFLFFIFVLLVQVFNLSVRLSQSDTKIKELTQHLAIERFERHVGDGAVTDERPTDPHC